MNRYEYRVVEVDPGSDKLEGVLTQWSAAGWKLHTIVPTYGTAWKHPEENQTDVHVSVAKMIFERERDIT